MTSNIHTELHRLWLAISGHGHGHFAQIAPLIHALQEHFPALTILVQSELPAPLLKNAFGNKITIRSEATDVGMVMSGPMTVLRQESLDAYRRFHDTWDERYDTQLTLFDDWQPDLVIGDIPYLPLAAASACGIPTVAVCSLNWADILKHYCADLDGAADIVDAIRNSYASADMFLRPAPSMPMETLGNTVEIGPLFTTGNYRRRELDAVLPFAPGKRLVLVTLGGIAGQVDITQWPRFDNIVFLVPAAWLDPIDSARSGKPTVANHFISIESTGMSYADLFASSDALITKPGYGAFTAAGGSALPVLYCERGDWPEEPYLVDWLTRVGRAEAIDWPTLMKGNFAQSLDALLRQPSKQPADAKGAADGVRLIKTLMMH